MKSNLPKDFSSSAENYRLCCEVWNNVVRKIILDAKQQSQWMPWLKPIEFGNAVGVDGSPICSFVNNRTRKGIMIYGLNGGGPLGFSSYMEVNGDEKLGVVPIETLVVHSSRSFVSLAEKVLAEWISGGFSFKQMKPRTRLVKGEDRK